MISEFGQNIWVAEGGNVQVAGFHYPTRMAVILLPDEKLFVWSPIPLGDELRNEIDKLGEVSYIIAPNSLHHLSIPQWNQAYPSAKLYAAPKLQEKRKDITFDSILGDVASKEWVDDIEQVVVQGNIITSEVVFFHKPSQTVLFTDLIQQFPKGWHSGWRGIIAKLDLMSEPEPTVPRKFRLAFTNRTLARKSLKQILSWPTERVLMAHGQPIMKNGSAYLKLAFKWLIK